MRWEAVCTCYFSEKIRTRRKVIRRRCSLPIVVTVRRDYSCFGAWISQFANEAGDGMRYLARDKARAIELLDHDYWLFDSRKLVRTYFGGDDYSSMGR